MIRFARPDDGPQVMPILNQIFEEMEIEQLQALPQKRLFEILTDLFLTEDYRYSYRRTLVAVDEQDQVQGIAVSYPEAAEATIDAPLQDFLAKYQLPIDFKIFTDKEAQPGEWYLDSLAVAPKSQHQGLGGQLIAAVKAQIPQTYQTLSLNVDVANPKAKRLYLRQGFQVCGELMIGTHRYEHMCCEVNQSSQSN